MRRWRFRRRRTLSFISDPRAGRFPTHRLSSFVASVLQARTNIIPLSGRDYKSLLLAALATGLALLARLAANLFASIAYALALVGLRLAYRAKLGRRLADELLVDPFDDNEGR